MSTTTYDVTGMTCGHCVAAVTEEVGALPGVTAVSIELRPGATSRVTVTAEVLPAPEDVRAAVEEAGYELAAAP